MTVFILESVPTSLRGELSRWMLEPKAGVFVARLSARVREKLWEEIIKKMKDGGSLMIYAINNEQGLQIKSFGKTARSIRDFEGISLVNIL